MQVAGSIVTYNPEMSRLKENVAAIYPQVDKLIIVDNASDDIDGVEAFFIEYDNLGKVVFIKNDINKGLAHALNIVLITANELSIKWLVTMDQDSVLGEGYVEACKQFLWANKEKKVGVISPRIIDRNNEKELKLLSQPPNEIYSKILVCITSGAFTNIEESLKFGGFDEDFFIDRIDFDLCLNLRWNHYMTYRLEQYYLLHELGNITKHRLYFFKEKYTTNHSALRLYYIYRNYLMLKKKHRHKVMYDRALEMWFKGRENYMRKHVRNIIYFEQGKWNKLLAIVKGLLAGWRYEVKS